MKFRKIGPRSTTTFQISGHGHGGEVDDDDVEATRQKILSDILSDTSHDGLSKAIPENFERILNPIFFDFSSS
jgi:hypothetical protein